MIEIIIGIILSAYLLAGMGAAFLRSMQMFQLAGYHGLPHARWLAANSAEMLKCLLFFPHYNKLRKQSKKKLVFTPRVLRMCAVAIIYNAVLVLIILFLLPVSAKTVGFVVLLMLAQYAPILACFLNKPVEKAIGKRYIGDAKRVIDSLPLLTTVGITGSYGKTSVKYFLTQMLQTTFNTVMTPESYNTTMGVVKVVRGQLTAATQIFVCEMGAKKPGEIKEICDIVKPAHAVITAVGPQHLETFGSLENIIKTKFELADSIYPDGAAALNFGNEYIREKAGSLKKKVLSYALNSEDCYCTAKDIVQEADGTSFTVRFGGGEEFQAKTRLLGVHNVENIIGAAAMAYYLGVSAADISLAVGRLTGVPHRLELRSAGESVIIDDAFNSNPAGAKAALDVLDGFSKHGDDVFKIVITPGMVELGDRETELHTVFGRQMSAVADAILLVGAVRTAPIKAGALQSGFDKKNLHTFDSFNQAFAFAQMLDSSGKKKVILLENDLPDNY